MIAIDTETWLIGPGRQIPPLVCLTYCNGARHGLYHRTESWQEPVRLGLRTGIVGHNIAFDLAVCGNADPSLWPLIWQAYEERRVFDMGLWDRLEHIAEGDHMITKTKSLSYSLSALAWRHFQLKMEGKEGQDAWRFRYSELHDTPRQDWPAAAVDYAVQDARVTWALWDELSSSLVPGTFHLQAKAAWALQLASAWGMRANPDAVASLTTKWEGELAAARGPLLEGGLLRADGSRNMAAIQSRIEAAHQADDLEVPKTATGRISTARPVIEAAARTNPALLPLTVISKVGHYLDTYAPWLTLGCTEPVHPRYDVIKTSGRCSAFKPPVQQYPRKGGVREAWQPLPGRLFVSADLGTAELCALAQINLEWFGQSAMADAIIAGKDLHLDMAAAIKGISYDEMAAWYATGDEEADDLRTLAKAAGFGYPGGLGPEAFCDFAFDTYGVVLTVAEARALKATWLKKYPEMRLYFDKISKLCGGYGGTFTHTLKTGFVRGRVGFTDGANHPFQHYVACIVKSASWRVVRACFTEPDSPLYGSRLVINMHDELVLSSPAALAPAGGDELSRIMIACSKLLLPDVPMQAEPAISRVWSKSAKTVRNAAGELQICEV